MKNFWLIGSMLFVSSIAVANDFPTPTNTLEDAHAIPTNVQESLKKFQMPEGFQVTLSAMEPEVQNPIAVNWDSRGRLWVAENYTYGDHSLPFDLRLRDRILILEDTDGDGVFDSRKVFTDNLQMLTSVEVGHGGVWVMCPPLVMFIPDRDGDDIPDGPAEVVLDGFTVGTDSPHNFANGLRFGPDGWLYGRVGGTCPGQIGVPGTPDESRVGVWGGMWRFNPKTKIFETLVTGTTNPWGHDWNSLGELFFINTVNGHFWHAFAGGHYDRFTGLSPNRFTYRLIQMHADHWHFDTGKNWFESRDGVANELGGGHAHTGGMIYLGDNWPKKYLDQFYMINMHGRRLNSEILEREGSGYVAKHGKDVIITDDTWFRPIEVTYGPDGGVYIIDWADTGECHEHNGVHRTSGRIYKFTNGQPDAKTGFDLAEMSDQELVDLHLHANEWYPRAARKVLANRLSTGTDLGSAREGLLKLFNDHSQPTSIRLRSLHSLYVAEGCSKQMILGLLSEEDEALRVWGVRLLTDRWPLDAPTGPVVRPAEITKSVEIEAREMLPTLVNLAQTDKSGLVRLALASTLQRLPLQNRAELAIALTSHAGDADDHNLPLLVWYGLISLADQHSADLVKVAENSKWPLVTNLVTRRLTENLEKNPESLNRVLEITSGQDQAQQLAVLIGMTDALRGWQKANAPAGWEEFFNIVQTSGNEDLLSRAREIAVVFGDGRALDEVRKIAFDDMSPMDVRRSALQTLIDNKPDDLEEICQKLVQVRNLNVVAARGLSLFDKQEIGQQLVNAYWYFLPEERVQVVSILTSRPSFALPLLRTIQAGHLPLKVLTAFHVRQMHTFQNQEITDLLNQVWGELRESPEEKARQIAELKEKLSDDVLTHANLSAGRLVFAESCGKCHRLYGEGTQIGPDLTGSNRSDLHYLVENILDPSASVQKDFRMTIFVLDDGRVLNGVITAETDQTITLQALTESLTLDKRSIEEMIPTTQSPMPEGLLQTLTEDQVRDLIAYLRHPTQVDLPDPGNRVSEK